MTSVSKLRFVWLPQHCNPALCTTGSPAPPRQTQLPGPSGETKTTAGTSTHTNSFCTVRYAQKFLSGWIRLSRPQARSDTVCWGCREPVPAPARPCLHMAGPEPAASTQPAQTLWPLLWLIWQKCRPGPQQIYTGGWVSVHRDVINDCGAVCGANIQLASGPQSLLSPSPGWSHLDHEVFFPVPSLKEWWQIQRVFLEAILVCFCIVNSSFTVQGNRFGFLLEILSFRAEESNQK